MSKQTLVPHTDANPEDRRDRVQSLVIWRQRVRDSDEGPDSADDDDELMRVESQRGDGWHYRLQNGTSGIAPSLADALRGRLVLDQPEDVDVHDNWSPDDPWEDELRLPTAIQVTDLSHAELAEALAGAGITSAVFDWDGPAIFDGRYFLGLQLAWSSSSRQVKDFSDDFIERWESDGVGSGGPMTREYGEAIFRSYGSWFFTTLGDSFDGWSSFAWLGWADDKPDVRSLARQQSILGEGAW